MKLLAHLITQKKIQIKPCASALPCAFLATHGKASLCRVPDGMRMAKIQAHGKIRVSGSGGPYSTVFYTNISNEIKEKDDKANKYERLRRVMHTTAPAALVARTLLVIYIAGSQALFKEATYDRTDSDEEYNRPNQLR